MGQLFNRFKEFIKSEIRHKEYDTFYQDNELQKIIDELNNSSHITEEQFQSKKDEPIQNNENPKMDLNRAYQILEIPHDADWETIQSSYRRLIKEYHPDKVNNLGKEIRLLAEKKTIEINQAYEYIKTIKNIK